ncbi:MAG: hypothetical protein FWF26_03880, partial [Treponema sp.]|nr:hypothetical protein [Treponema sp.]
MLMAENAVALCAVGAEKTVSNELKKLGLQIIESGFGRVRFRTDLAGLYRALMGLRAADRVLLEAACFTAADFDALFEGVRDVPWEDYIPRMSGLRVAKVRTNRSRLEAETSIQAVVHKAAAERLCQKWGVSRLPGGSLDPSTSGKFSNSSFTGGKYKDAYHSRLIKNASPPPPENEAELRVYIEKDQVSILLDLSGEPLFKRGYRTMGGTAPLRETTAAAIILYSGWRRKYSLYDPFCGSGTIAIEAAMYAWDIAPGIGRHFALERLLLCDRGVEQNVRKEFLEKVDFSRPVRIGGSDNDAGVVAAARSNMTRALALAGRKEADTVPVFRQCSMDTATPPEGFLAKAGYDTVPEKEFQNSRESENTRDGECEGFIITNPPYGRRLGDT